MGTEEGDCRYSIKGKKIITFPTIKKYNLDSEECEDGAKRLPTQPPLEEYLPNYPTLYSQ